MGNSAIKVEGLSKAYQLGEIGTGTISRDIERWFAKIRGKEDPFLRIGETNVRTRKGTSDVVWSLRDVTFEIEQGDAVGIIGRNGAGKSTLLKIISRITSPTTGRIFGNGRIASLLEVGTGFHPELTGRENIFLNGAILGMRKREIQRKFDQIVDFAGVERYVDTPVKRYSSGMYVRLAFAVAAHLESEILIVDEVLAVGDAEFQQKCLGKMGEVSKGEGRTVLFVSHNMDSIQKLCKTSIYLCDGRHVAHSETRFIVEQYRRNGNEQNASFLELDHNYTIENISISPYPTYSLENCELTFTLSSKALRKINSIVPLIVNQYDQRAAIIDLRGSVKGEPVGPCDPLRLSVKIKSIPLIEGDYSLGLFIEDEIRSDNYMSLYHFTILPRKTSESSGEYDRAVRGVVNLNYETTKL